MEVEPDFVRAAGSRAAPSFTTEYFSFLSFGGVSVARIETNSFVSDRWEGVF